MEGGGKVWGGFSARNASGDKGVGWTGFEGDFGGMLVGTAEVSEETEST